MAALRVTILGSGTCVPSLERSSCSVLVEAGAAKMVFDLGAGAMKRLLEKGIVISDITHLFFSHFHPDHTGEFASFLFALKYAGLQRHELPLTIAGSRGLCDFYSRLLNVYGNWIEQDTTIIEFVEMSNNSYDNKSFDWFDLESRPMNHIESSLGYRVSISEDATVVYSGDTDYCDNLVELARGIHKNKTKKKPLLGMGEINGFLLDSAKKEIYQKLKRGIQKCPEYTAMQMDAAVPK